MKILIEILKYDRSDQKTHNDPFPYNCVDDFQIPCNVAHLKYDHVILLYIYKTILIILILKNHFNFVI